MLILVSSEDNCFMKLISASLGMNYTALLDLLWMPTYFVGHGILSTWSPLSCLSVFHQSAPRRAGSRSRLSPQF
jgi:hypothetical protein